MNDFQSRLQTFFYHMSLHRTDGMGDIDDLVKTAEELSKDFEYLSANTYPGRTINSNPDILITPKSGVNMEETKRHIEEMGLQYGAVHHHQVNMFLFHSLSVPNSCAVLNDSHDQGFADTFDVLYKWYRKHVRKESREFKDMIHDMNIILTNDSPNVSQQDTQKLRDIHTMACALRESNERI